MKKIVLLLFIQLCLVFNIAFPQKKNTKDTTLQNATVKDAMDFVAANINMKFKAYNTEVSNSFDETFATERDYSMAYNYEGEYEYNVVFANNCVIRFVETLTGKTRISFADNEEDQDETPYYSNFGYLKHDTIDIRFANIARVEAGKTSITLYTYNNMNLIDHSGTVTQTPPSKRKNDLIKFLKDEEEDVYKKFRKFLKKHEINYSVYPNEVKNFKNKSNSFTFSNLDKELCKRLAKAFTFLQQNCGAKKEKF